MQKFSTALVVALTVLLTFGGCQNEKSSGGAEPSSFSFPMYPGSRYLARLTELVKQAHVINKPDEPAPPTAIYDTDAPIESVAEFYAKAYGYGHVAPDATNNLSAAKPAAYYRSGSRPKLKSSTGPHCSRTWRSPCCCCLSPSTSGSKA